MATDHHRYTDAELGAWLRHRRDKVLGLSLRELGATAGVAPNTLVAYERGGPYTPRVLRRLAAALGVKIERDSEDFWAVTPIRDHSVTESPTVSGADGTLLTLRVPPGFLDSLTADERAELEADALLEVMRLARAVRRREQPHD